MILEDKVVVDEKKQGPTGLRVIPGVAATSEAWINSRTKQREEKEEKEKKKKEDAQQKLINNRVTWLEDLDGLLPFLECTVAHASPTTSEEKKELAQVTTKAKEVIIRKKVAVEEYSNEYVAPLKKKDIEAEVERVRCGLQVRACIQRHTLVILKSF